MSEFFPNFFDPPEVVLPVHLSTDEAPERGEVVLLNARCEVLAILYDPRLLDVHERVLAENQEAKAKYRASAIANGRAMCRALNGLVLDEMSVAYLDPCTPPEQGEAARAAVIDWLLDHGLPVPGTLRRAPD